jgi:non-homologous end joining protein Ku
LFALGRLGQLKSEYRERAIALAHDVHRTFVVPGTGTTREHVIAIEPRGKGLLGVTLRYPQRGGLFRRLTEREGDQRDVGLHNVETKAGQFHPEQFENHYERALQ